MAIDSINGNFSIGKISPINYNNSGVNDTDTSQDAVSFGDLLNTELSKVNNLLQEKDIAEQQLATGEVKDIHSVMIAAEKADLALQYTLAIRNKFMDAYQEIMRMQV